MKAKDCKAIRREIEEADLGQEPGALTVSHLHQCSPCLEFFESERKLRQVVASLAPVEAPADFDFRLRARIANEQHRSRRGFTVGNLSLGIPTLAFAALVLLAGGIFLLPSLNSLNEAPQVIAPQPVDHNVGGRASGNVPPPANVARSNDEGTEVVGVSPLVRPAPQSRRPNAAGKKETLAFRPAGRLEVRDSAVVGATAVKQEDSVGDSQIPLIFPLQTLRVSVDDGSGVSRTISFPSVSFGSQRVLTSAGSGLNPSAKVIW